MTCLDCERIESELSHVRTTAQLRHDLIVHLEGQLKAVTDENKRLTQELTDVHFTNKL